jgi:hypothetical protein
VFKCRYEPATGTVGCHVGEEQTVRRLCNIVLETVQVESNSLTPTIGGDRKYLGVYLRGEPHKTSLPHGVVPNTK